ncbi:hypothetical protein Vretimale_13197 [Volvox reticuliferus]|uniref:Uncharacterized protein n=1 Tax=Volvox reticuliferus TaxID=1737510 RepID=A0A8J4CUW5_9CHLO|nr:hypothetical protein Vretifemale_14203 [Volvox reticuliferus]GIM09369.1 hypothetical protein Vretimale_13197 [Volvox reticuliferus]
MEPSVAFPAELRPYRAIVDPYLDAKLRQFGNVLLRHISNSLTADQIKSFIDEAMVAMHQLEAAVAPQRPLRLVIRHDCQSTGCGDQSCGLCQSNPSRLCTRNVKPKYLIDDHLRAKCGAQLRVELVDDTGACHTEGLPAGVRLELQVLNGERYKELCPDNTLLSVSNLQSCIISNHTRALLRREGMADTDLQVFLPLERGSATLSDLTLTTSSEALLSGKAPTFRLLVWAVQANGESVPYVTYVVSESFVVATKRVKHAIKSDIPSVMDSVSKLVHIGKATVDKLTDLRTAFQEEGFDFKLPDELVKVEKVGQFKKLIDMSESNNDLRNRLRHVLKLSPEKWEEVCQHATSAVIPDFRNRVWWCPPLRLGLLYACKNGAVLMENPTGIIRLGATQDAPSQIFQLNQLSHSDLQGLPRLKANAIQNWYMTNHPNWAIIGDAADKPMPQAPPAPLNVTQVPNVAGAGPSNGGAAGVTMVSLGANMVGVPPQAAYTMPAGPPSPALGGLTAAGGGGATAYGREMFGQHGIAYGQPDAGAYGVGAPGGMGDMPMLLAGLSPLPAQVTGGHRISNSSPFALQQPQPPQQLQQQTQQAQQSPVAATGGVGVKGQVLSPQTAVGPGLAPGVQVVRDCGGSVPPVTNGSGSGTGSGLIGGQAVGMMGPPQLHPPAAGGPGSNTSSGTARSPFAADAMMMSIADSFPKFHTMPQNPQGPAGAGGQLAGQSPDDRHGATAHHLDDGGHGQQAGSMFSLDMINTDLMVNGLNSLVGNDTSRSIDWMQQLHGIGGQASQLVGINSYTMADVAQPNDDGSGDGGVQGQAGGSGGGGGLAGSYGDAGGGFVSLESERRLSSKLNSITLDYDKVLADHAGA